MSDFFKYNKVTGAYWLKNPIATLSVRIKTKLQKGFIKLPTFEEYNGTDTDTLNLEKSTTEEFNFKWQEKVFSRYEISKYSNVHNCVTETELAYFQKLENSPCQGNKIFTFINEDFYLPLPFDSKLKKETSTILNLNSCFKKLNLESNGKLGIVFSNGSNSTNNLFKSNEDVSLEPEEWMAMHIVYDNSEYSEDSQLLFKQECILLSLYYNSAKNYILISPDSNDIETNPYSVGEGTRLHYSVEIDYGGKTDGEELSILLNKLHKKWEKRHKYLMNFTAPPIGKKKVHLSFEIVSAKGFDMDNIYIEYHIKIPDGVECSDTLEGKTHTTSALRTEHTEEWKYGHIVDLEMEMTTGLEPSPIKLYLEVISTDWWGRQRTEGYTYLPLNLDPGCHSRTLSCNRPEELDTVEAESRRFFVGGCHLIKDLEVLDGQMQNASYSFTSTGSVFIRWNTLLLSAVPGVNPEYSGGVLQGVDAVLRQYKRAKAKLAAVVMD